MKPKVDLKIVSLIFLLSFLVIIEFAFVITKTPIHFGERAIDVIYGIAGGIASFTITFLITQKYFHSANDKIEDIKNVFIPHDIDSKIILNAVQGKSISLVVSDRKILEGKGYYENNYINANDIRISSISLNPLIKYLCSSKQTDNHLINQLKTRKNVIVKIILMSPKSPIVKILDKQEKNNQELVSVKIQTSIDLLKDFAKINNGSLAEGSGLNIVITSQTMNFTISYAGNTVRNPSDVLLLGFLFGYREGGPLYKVPIASENNMYNDCLIYFEELYNNSELIFSWSDKKNFRPIK
jgi:uncharacterized membrane protein (DUF485 family)